MISPVPNRIKEEHIVQSDKDDILEVSTPFMHNIINYIVERLIRKHFESKFSISNLSLFLDHPKMTHNAEEKKTSVTANVVFTISDDDLNDLLWKTLWKK